MLNYVTLIGYYPAAGYSGPIVDAPPLSGSVVFVPSVPLSDTADHESFRAQPVVAEVVNGQFTVELLATDNPTISPAGWGWVITESVGSLPATQWSFFLPYSDGAGATQYLDEITPTQDVIPQVAYVLVTGSSMTGPLTLGAALIIPAGAAAGMVWTAQDDSGTGAWETATGPVTSVNDQTGAVVLDADDVGADEAGAAASALTSAKGYANETFVALSLVGAASGVAPLDDNELVPSANLPTATSEAQGAILLPLALTSGGTGATTAAGARTALGLGTAATQPTSAFDPSGAAEDAQEAAENYAAGLQPTTENPQPLNVGGTGVSATSGTELLTELGAGSAAFQPTSAFDPAGAAEEAADASLPLDGGTMAGPVNMGGSKITDVGNGSAPQDVVAYGQLGSAAFQPTSAFDVSGAAAQALEEAEGYAAGLQPTTESPLPLTVGGTGASTAAGARGALGLGSAATQPSSAFDPSGAAAAAAEASLPLGGGTMSGPIGMGGSKITGLGNGSAAQDGVAYGQLGSAAFQPTSAFDAAGTAAALPGNTAFNPGDHGYKTWTFDPAFAQTTTALTAGVVYVHLVKLPATVAALATVDLYLSGSPVGLANSYVGLYSYTGAQLAISGDQSAGWDGNGFKSSSFTASYNNPAAGYYYVAFVIGSASTMPAVARGPAEGLATLLNANLANAGLSLRYATIGTGQTSLPASLTVASLVADGVNTWLGVR